MRKRKMARRYDKLKEDEEAIKRLVKLGVVDYSLQRNIEIFEQFEMHPDLCAECRYSVLACEHQLSESMIKKVVLDLKKKID